MRKLLPIFVMYALLLCSLTFVACTEDERTKLMAVSADFFDSLEGISSLTEQYNKSMLRVTDAKGNAMLKQQLSDADADHIYAALDRVGKGVSSFKRVLKETPVITANNKSKFLPILDNIAGELYTLNQQDVFFDSAGAREKFDEGVKIARDSITVIRSRMVRIRSPVETASLPLGKFASQ